MAFSSAVVEKQMLIGGVMIQYGTWNGDSVTTGTITADTATGNPDLKEVLMWGASSDGDTAVVCARDVYPNQLKLTFTGSDTGKYFIIGRCA